MVDGPERSFESIVEMDAELSRLARGAGGLRLGLGLGFEALAQRGGHHEMGFSSLEAYALERCERAERWVQEARALARRLDRLPQTCRALRAGRVTWSMADVIAKAATAQDEEWWLAEAGRRTVRQMRQLARERRELGVEEGGAEAVSAMSDCGSEKFCTLGVRVDREDAWLFECARMIVGRLGGRTMEDVVYALTAEGCTTLQPMLPADTTANWNEEGTDAAQRAWEAELRRWREEAEERCEATIRDRSGSEGDGEVEELEWEGDISAIDAQIRRLAAELTTREVAMGKLAERFWQADGWRRLGFATESQYVRERLGVSLSSVEAKRRLARALRRLQPLEEAIEEGQIGYEAARLVTSVASQENVAVWIERAGERTVKHLREEVDAVQMLARLTGQTGAHPPSVEVMAEVERAQSRITSGQIFEEALGHVGRKTQMSAPASPASVVPDAMATQAVVPATMTMPALEAPIEEGCDGARGEGEAVQMSALSRLSDRLLGQAQMFSRGARLRSRGRLTLRLRVTVETAGFYRWLERLFYRYSTVRMPFLRFLCRTLIETWGHALGSKVAYADIYARDGYRCKTPVCSRSDLTPHHLRFRSAGGDDGEENLATLCVWCHLEGVHGGRLTAVPPASGIQWRIGREAHTIVEGRRRVRGEVGSCRMPSAAMKAAWTW